MIEFWRLLHRLVDVVDDLLRTRAVLAIGALSGFYLILWRVSGILKDPPAAELFTLVNIALVPLSSAASFYFGTQVGTGRNGGDRD